MLTDPAAEMPAKDSNPDASLAPRSPRPLGPSLALPLLHRLSRRSLRQEDYSAKHPVHSRPNNLNQQASLAPRTLPLTPNHRNPRPLASLGTSTSRPQARERARADRYLAHRRRAGRTSRSSSSRAVVCLGVHWAAQMLETRIRLPELPNREDYLGRALASPRCCK